MKVDIFGDRVLMQAGPVPVTETMLTSAVVSLVLVVGGLTLAWFVTHRPEHWLSSLALLVIDSIDQMVIDVTGRPHATISAMAGSLFVFIAACNLAGQLPGVNPATGSLATTSALAVVVFLAVPVAGIHARGWRDYLLHYFRPNILFLPLHLISEAARTLALSVRLFGNVMSGHLVVGLLVALSGLLVPVPMMALEVLIGLLQAYIFTVLTIVYLGAAIHAGDES